MPQIYRVGDLPTANRGVSAKGAKLQEGMICLRFFVEIPPDQLAWPAITIGDKEPAKEIQLETPWVEDIEGSVLTLGAMEDEFKQAFDKMQLLPSSERTTTATLVGIHNLQTSARVKQIAISISAGGHSCTTRVTSTLFGFEGRPSILRLKASGPKSWIA